MALDPVVVASISEWAARYPRIRRVVLFGSLARGDGHQHSDHDFAFDIEPRNRSTPREHFRGWGSEWREELEAIVGTSVSVELIESDPEPVDLDLQASIARDGVVIYEAS